MILKIDVEASIAKGKLVCSSWFVNLINQVMPILFFLFFLFCDYGYLRELNFNPPWILVFLIILFLIFSLFILINRLVFMDKLTKVEGISPSKNKEIIETIVKANEYEILKEETDITIIKASQRFGTKRQLTIIFDRNNILVNVISFGKSDYLKVSINFYQDKETLESFILDFQKEIS